jgi:hypothetical protein
MAAAETPETEMATAKKKARRRIGGGVGIVDCIVKTISRDKGASIEELVAVLTKTFPDRNPDSMQATCSVQAWKNATSKGRDEKRGLVYFRRRK